MWRGMLLKSWSASTLSVGDDWFRYPNIFFYLFRCCASVTDMTGCAAIGLFATAQPPYSMCHGISKVSCRRIWT
jgi:hypothetical protein